MDHGGPEGVRVTAAERLKQLRDQERTTAAQRARTHRETLQDARKSMQLALSNDLEARRDVTLRSLADQLQSAAASVGRAQADAAAYEHERQRQLAEREARERELRAAQQQRYMDALAKKRMQTQERAAGVQSFAQRRSNLLQQSRAQASAFTELQREKQQEASAERELRLAAELERRRMQQPSLTDFRFSRLHERVDVPERVLHEPSAAPGQLQLDPEELARETEARCVTLAVLSWCWPVGPRPGRSVCWVAGGILLQRIFAHFVRFQMKFDAQPNCETAGGQRKRS